MPLPSLGLGLPAATVRRRPGLRGGLAALMGRLGGKASGDIPLKRQGFIGLYHPFKGRVYAGTNIVEDEDLYSAYLFGENAILSSPSYGEYRFQENIERHCYELDVNRVHGMVLPPSEGGLVNNPADTNLWSPATSPGMIQGAVRYSQISRLYPQITGMIIDDFWRNYQGAIQPDQLRSIRGALLGKRVDPSGKVEESSPASTPHLKLYVVTYEGEVGTPDESALECIDGVNFWMYNQQSYYRYFDDFIIQIKERYPDKEIIPGIYIHNSDFGDMGRDSISFLLEKSIELYEDGYVSGVLLFAGHWLVKKYISRERSNAVGLSDLFYRLYYPYLGSARLQVVDSSSGRPLEKAYVKVTSSGKKARVERAVTQKYTNQLGWFEFSGWGGKSQRGMEYTITVEKAGYRLKKAGLTIVPGEDQVLPAISLRPEG